MQIKCRIFFNYVNFFKTFFLSSNSIKKLKIIKYYHTSALIILHFNNPIKKLQQKNLLHVKILKKQLLNRQTSTKRKKKNIHLKNKAQIIYIHIIKY